MLPAPEVNFQKTPVTLILAALILAVAGVCFVEPERREYYYRDLRLGMSQEIWKGEVWRPFTTTLLHGDVLHAVFNVYWLAVFGPLIEHWLGSVRTLALIVLLALVSSLAQYVGSYYLIRWAWVTVNTLGIHGLDESLAVAAARSTVGLVGLSGVNYGLFGLAWAGSWRRTEFRLVCNRDTIRMMMVWLIFCMVATWLKWMNVANVAHLAGLALGLLIGQAIFDRRRRWLWAGAATFCSLAALATLWAAPGHPRYERVQLDEMLTVRTARGEPGD